MMKFEYYNPTRLIFGAGSLERLGEVVSKYGKKALLVIGKGSVKKTGTFDRDRKSTRLNSSHANMSYAVFCLKKKKKTI
ncbi:MAG TPA: hypothetical protein DEA58_01105, partial [Pseudothermotoga sp.]|nr:hypothetical protein [Pseudothermotoga sp.]